MTDYERDDYSGPGVERTVTLSPAEVTALQTLSQWEHAAGYLRTDYKGDRTKDGRDSIDGWVREFLDAVAVMARLGDRIEGDSNGK